MQLLQVPRFPPPPLFHRRPRLSLDRLPAVTHAACRSPSSSTRRQTPPRCSHLGSDLCTSAYLPEQVVAIVHLEQPKGTSGGGEQAAGSVRDKRLHVLPNSRRLRPERLLHRPSPHASYPPPTCKVTTFPLYRTISPVHRPRISPFPFLGFLFMELAH